MFTKDVAVYFGRPATINKAGNEYLKHLYFLKGADFINTCKTPIEKFDNLGIFHNVFNKEINKYKDNYEKYDTWIDFYNDIDVSFLKDYKLIYCFHPQIMEIWDEKKKTNYNFTDLKYKSFLKYLSIGNEMANLIILSKASEQYNIPLYQFNMEMGAVNLKNMGLNPFEYRRFHGYNYKDIECLTSMPYYYTHIEKSFFEEDCDKTIDFTFYGSYSEDECPTKIKDVESLKTNYLNKFGSTEFKFINRKINKDQFIPIENYISKLKESRYTYIAPSYMNDVVAIDRFEDALFNDCLPLFGDYVKLDDVSRTFDYDFEQIRIKNFNISEQNRLKTIDEIKTKILNYTKPTEIFKIC